MKALKGFRATDISLMVLLFFHAICAIITGTLLPQIIKEFSIDYATAGSIETLRSYAILFILVITVKLLRVVSAKTLFVLSRFGIAVGFVMSALSGNYSFFLAGVILAGLGAGFVESLIAQTITNLHQAENNTEKFFNAIQGVFSIAVILIPLLREMSALNLYNTIWAVIFPIVGWPFGVFLMKQFYEGVPTELCEAASIDGLSEYGIWWHIMLPLSLPALSTLTIFTFVNTWNDFLGPLIYLTKPELKTIQIGLRMFITQYSAEYGLIMAASVVALIPVLIVFLSLQKYFVQGVASTGIKG